MSVENNIALMKRWFEEVWNQGRIATVHELLAKEARGFGQGETGRGIHGPRDFVPFVERIRGAFPDIKTQVEDVFGMEDQVIVRWSAVMTHRGDHLGVPASNKEVHITGMTMVTIEGGQIVEGWDNWDQLGLMRQIDALGEPKAVLLSNS